MPRKTLTDRMVAALKPEEKRYTVPDPDLAGHMVRITPKGAKTYAAVARDPAGRQVWATIGSADVYKIADAREAAREAIKRIKAGESAFEEPPAPPETFGVIAEDWLKRHVKKRGLRSQGEVERVLRRDVMPAWQDRDFISIRRRDVTELLDDIEDESGPSAADHVLAVVRGIMNWYASRSDDYLPPIAKGMRRTDPKNRKRARILDDEELVLVWKTAEANGKFGSILRLALLTAQRRDKVATLKWADVALDGEWSIAADDREKGTGGALLLPEAAVDIIRAQERVGGNPYVFPGRGDGHFAGFSPCKRRFNEKVAKANGGEQLERWTIHDLRRTARSLMARAGVRPDIAERVMGHVQEGIVEVYDRHSYRDEKAAALKALAALVETIVNPPAGENVVQMQQAAE